MESQSVPAELLEVREKIDRIDSDIVGLLAQRFSLTHQVGLLKASQDLMPLDASREARKLTELRSLCQQYDLNPELVAELFTLVMQEVVRNHKKLRQQQENP
jgi:chorismate mutase